MLKSKYPVFNYKGKKYSEYYWLKDDGDTLYDGDVDDLIDLLVREGNVEEQQVWYWKPSEGEKWYKDTSEMIEDYSEELNVGVEK